MANFEAFRWNILLSANLLFLKSEYLTDQKMLVFGAQLQQYVRFAVEYNYFSTRYGEKLKLIMPCFLYFTTNVCTLYTEICTY